MSQRIKVRNTGTLVTAAFPKANPPLVWSLDLHHYPSVTLTVQGEQGDWELGLTAPKGTFEPVAHFVQREDAEEALAAVEKKLLNKRSDLSFSAKIFILVGSAAIMVVFLVTVLGIYLTHQVKELAKNLPNVPNISALQHPGLGGMQRPVPGLTAPTPAQPEQGVPLSADDVLKAPQ